MTQITFSKTETEVLTQKIQRYFAKELHQDLGRFDTEFLLDFFAKEIGPYFYNRGLYDAQAILTSKLDDLGEAIYELEIPTEFKR